MCTSRKSTINFDTLTHYQRILEYIVPDYVHILCDGRLVKSGGAALVTELEAGGLSCLSTTLRMKMSIYLLKWQWFKIVHWYNLFPSKK